MSYRCSSCGSREVGIDPSRPSVDDRYAIGSCRAERKSGKTLVREDVYDSVHETQLTAEYRADRADAAKAVMDPRYKSRRKLTKERVALGKQFVEELTR